MCGFTGFIDPTRQYPDTALPRIVTEMAATIRHRGPDDSGSWVSPNDHLALGFQRLSIIDLTPAGHQPLVSPDQQFAMVFNGEIYNYIELKAALAEDGHQVDSHSDSVILFYALQHWGVDKTLAFINGMFAIAFWHGPNKQLYLIRDRIGQKPLYYFYDGTKLLFASELKALIAYPSFNKEIDRNAVGSFLQYAYIPEPMAIYKNTYKVKPAEYLVYSSDKKALHTQSYWSLEKATQAIVSKASESELLENLHQTLKQSVKIRMRSDVPFGSFLSGGIDSSLITALMQSQSSQKIKTFSIGFNEAQYNEAPFAKTIAAHLGTDHTELYVTSAEAQAVIPKLAIIYDEPFADSSQIPTYLLSKLTRQHVTVALSGDGGDESFAGYNRHFWVPKMWRYMGNKPKLFKKGLEGTIKLLTPEQWNRSVGKLIGVMPKKFKYYNVGDKLYKLLPFLESQQPIDVYGRLSSIWQQPNQILQGYSDTQNNPATLDLISEMMYRDTKYYLPGDILTKVDRASMAVSLEVRSPFLDYHVIEAAWQLPMSMKLKGRNGKLVLKNMLAEYVPTELFERPKMGFGVPISGWLRGPLKEWGESLLPTSDDLFNRKIIRQYWDQHQAGHRNWQYPLWSILMFQSWRAEYHV